MLWAWRIDILCHSYLYTVNLYIFTINISSIRALSSALFTDHSDCDTIPIDRTSRENTKAYWTDQCTRRGLDSRRPKRISSLHKLLMRLGDETVYIAKSRKFKTQNQILSSTAIYILFWDGWFGNTMGTFINTNHIGAFKILSILKYNAAMNNVARGDDNNHSVTI